MKKIAALAAALLALFLAWISVIRMISPEEKQKALLEKAAVYIQDEAYISAVPLLSEAYTLSSNNRKYIEESLKKAYIETGNRKEYESLLQKQMNAREYEAQVFTEASDYYLSLGKIADAIAVRANAFGITGGETERLNYEAIRYAYTVSAVAYDYMSEAYGSHIMVMKDGLRGMASLTGITEIPCMYDKISTFDGVALVYRNGEIFAVNGANQRTALFRSDRLLPEGTAVDFGNFALGMVPIQMETGEWILADPSFTLRNVLFDNIRTFSGDGICAYAAAKAGGKWGVINRKGEFVIEPVYDDVIQNALGECYGQGIIFLKSGGKVIMAHPDGTPVTEAVFEDAKPFGETGCAAVKISGKWGFIDTSGSIVIEPAFEDALSFGGHLAAVKRGDLWGYIAVDGRIAIEPQFIDARSFREGHASVQTSEGWLVLSLIEYKKSTGLF